MTMKLWTATAAGLTLLAASACTTPQEDGSTADTVGATTDTSTDTSTDTTAATGDTSAGTGTSTGTGTGVDTGIPALVNVNLENVLNDLSVRLNIDRANIPVNAQIPIDVAANVCGVSVSVLSVSTGGQASCTATTATDELAQVVQQQISAGGSVGGGAQGGSTATTGEVETNTTAETNQQEPEDEPQ